MSRLDPLDGKTFDVAVIGGGILGAWCALDARSRGLDTVLIERNDWGAGTSQASSKIIHGGLRYLERMEFGLVRGALAERRRLAEAAPHLVWPCRFVAPYRRDDRVGGLRLRLATWLYRRLAGGEPPFGRFHADGDYGESPPEPALSPQGLRGSVSYLDALTDDARLVWTVVRTAREAGAVAVKGVGAVRIEPAQDGAVEIRIEDTQTKDTGALRARLAIAAAGPWTRTLLGEEAPERLIRGSHIVLPDVALRQALLVQSAADGRFVFLLPWYERTLVGTTEVTTTAPPDVAVPSAEEVDYLLATARRALRTTIDDSAVIGRFAGLRVLAERRSQSATALSRDFSFTEPRRNVLRPIGGKLTTARADAERLIDVAARRLSTSAATDDWRPTRAIRLAGFCPPDEQATHVARAQRLGLDDAVASALVRRHGATASVVLDRIEAAPTSGARLAAPLPFVRAEIEHAVDFEDATSVDDVLRRRIPLSILDEPSAEHAALARLALTSSGKG